MMTRRQVRLLRYIRPHWRAMTVVVLAMLVRIGLDVLRPWPTKLLIDQVLDGKPMPKGLEKLTALLPGSPGVQGLLWWVCVSTVVLSFAGKLMSMAKSVASVGLAQRMTYDLGADLFRHLQRLSLLYHSRRPVGDTIGRVTGDTYCVQELVSVGLVPLVESVAMLMTMFVIMWQLQPGMTLLSLAVVPFLVLASWFFRRAIKARTRERRDLEGEMMSMVEQTLSAMPAVQAFAREELESSRFRDYARQTVAAYQRSTWLRNWFAICTGLMTAVGAAGIMWVGAHDVLAGTMTIGEVLIFLAYLESLYGPLSTFTDTFAALQHSAAGADRVMDILDTETDVKDLPDAREVRLEGHVRFEDVTFGYEEARAVLKGVTLEARPGEVVAIVGPTGAGKTTLVNLLVRFFDPWSGRVTIDGYDVRRLAVRSLRRQVAMVLQEPFIFPLRVAENIAYGRPDAALEDIRTAAVDASADDFIQRLPGGYDAVVGERGATLSGGEKQRLSIARAFLKNAPILILDEPTSALDARTESMLLAALRRLMKGRTTFIIAHRLSTIRNADRIIVLDGGEIIEQGRHAELMACGGLYAGLYRQQMDIARHEPEPRLAEGVHG